MPSLRLLRDLAWAALGLGGALAGMRAVEALRPEVIEEDVSAPDSQAFLRQLPRAYVMSAASILASPLLGADAVRLPAVCGPLGLGVQLGSVSLRIWAMRELRGHYARGLRVVDEQPVVRTGPYRFVRHPGYVGGLLIWVGAALSARNLTAVALTTTAIGTAYRYRMDAEETLLRRDLPGYADYAATTRRLVPLPR